MIKICEICKKEYDAKVYNRRICYDKHYKICKYCHEKFELKQNTKVNNQIKRVCCYKPECIKIDNLEKVINTNIQKYGVSFPFQSNDIQNKVKETHLQKYGGNPFSNKEIRNKIKQTLISKYGVDHPMKNKIIKQKAQNNQKIKHNGKLAWNTDKQKETMIEKYGAQYSMQVEKIREKINKSRKNTGSISKVNINFNNILISNNINSEFEFYINNYFYDIHILNTNILIEINPTYTHNSTKSYRIGSGLHLPKDKYYHYNKTKNALENSYVCIHKFDWNTNEEIINLIKNIDKYKFEQKEPKLHWYNWKTKEHLLDNNFNRDEMIEKGFVEIYDDGINI